MEHSSHPTDRIACPLCHAPSTRPTRFSARDEAGIARPVFECGRCTGRFIANRPEAIAKVQVRDCEELDAAILRHEDAYFRDKRLLDELDYPYSLLPLVAQYGHGGTILELGCGASQLLPLLQRAGYQAEGFDGVYEVVHLARQNGVRVTRGDIDSIRQVLNGRRFDLIVGDQIFEHLLHPLHVLREIEGLLDEGGLVIFRMPNEGSLRRRIELAVARARRLKQPWCYFVDHWNYFNAAALRHCFEAAGYEILRLKQDLSPQGYLMARVLRMPGVGAILPGLVNRVDSRVLSNGLTIVARPRPRRRADGPLPASP